MSMSNLISLSYKKNRQACLDYLWMPLRFLAMSGCIIAIKNVIGWGTTEDTLHEWKQGCTTIRSLDNLDQQLTSASKIET